MLPLRVETDLCCATVVYEPWQAGFMACTWLEGSKGYSRERRRERGGFRAPRLRVKKASPLAAFGLQIFHMFAKAVAYQIHTQSVAALLLSEPEQQWSSAFSMRIVMAELHKACCKPAYFV